MEQSNIQHLFMTDAEITGHQRKQADMHDRLMAAIPEPKSDKDQIEELRVELAAEQEKVKALEATWIGYNKLQEQLAAAQATIKQMRDKFISIREYWNRDRNEMAMVDACEHAIETACDALNLPTNQDALNQIKAGYEATIADMQSNLLSACCYIECLGGNSKAYRIAHAIPTNLDALHEARAAEICHHEAGVYTKDDAARAIEREQEK